MRCIAWLITLLSNLLGWVSFSIGSVSGGSRWLWGLTVCLFCWGQSLPAQVSNPGGIITTRGSVSDALDVSYFLECSPTNSMACVHVRIQPPSASPRERELELRLLTCNEHSEIPGITIGRKVVLPESSTGVQLTIPLAVYSEQVYGNNQSNLNWQLQVFEEGRNVEASRAMQVNFAGGFVPLRLPPGERPDCHTFNSNIMGTAILNIVADGQTHVPAELVRIMDARGIPNAQTAAFTSVDNQLDLAIDGTGSARIRHVSSAPSWWQYYLQFDMVLLDADVLSNLPIAHPATAQALKVYLGSGGKLMVTGTPQFDCQGLVDRWLSDTTGAQWQHVPRRLEDVPRISLEQTFQDRSVADPLSGLNEPFLPSMNSMQPAADSSMGAPLRRVQQLSASRRLSTSSSAIKPGGLARDVLTSVDLAWQMLALSHQPVRRLALDHWILDESFEYDLNAVSNSSGSTLLADWRVISPEQVPSLPLLSFDLSWLPQTTYRQLDGLVAQVENSEKSGVAMRRYLQGWVVTVEPSLREVPIESLQIIDTQSGVSSQIHPSADGNWLYRNLIGSVGKPPVWTFCTIVILFGLVLGPGLLVLTGWIGRRSLMILLVPLVSIVTTALIVGYEVLHDGFGTTARITSVMVLDQQSDSGFVWSRQSYFSGWPPREGLRFPNDVYFRPVHGSMVYYYRHRSKDPRDTASSQIAIGREQSVWMGALKPRAQQQFLIGHALPTQQQIAMPIQVVSRPSGLEVTNQCEHALPFVLIRDQDTGYYLSDELPPGQSVLLDKKSFGEIAAPLSRLRADTLPQLPDDVRTSIWNNSDGASNDVIDRAWRGYFAEQRSDNILPPHCFVTIQPTVSGVYMPLSGTIVESQTLTVGRLRW